MMLLSYRALLNNYVDKYIGQAFLTYQQNCIAKFDYGKEGILREI